MGFVFLQKKYTENKNEIITILVVKLPLTIERKKNGNNNKNNLKSYFIFFRFFILEMSIINKTIKTPNIPISHNNSIKKL